MEGGQGYSVVGCEEGGREGWGGSSVGVRHAHARPRRCRRETYLRVYGAGQQKRVPVRPNE